MIGLVFPVSIECLTRSVSPKSESDLEKISENLHNTFLISFISSELLPSEAWLNMFFVNVLELYKGST